LASWGDHPTTELPLTPDAPAQARHWIQEAFELPEGQEAAVILMLSELVTNSVRHSGTGPEASVTISVWNTENAIHVQVEDPGQGAFTDAEDNAQHFGLGLVNSLAADWGISLHPTTVWFEVGLAR
jgi:two-component sensor histidine kinase